jgi:hypothetical protein
MERPTDYEYREIALEKEPEVGIFALEAAVILN